jgi:hypothetical protein
MDDDREEVYNEYKQLKPNEKMMLSFESDGIKKYLIRNN